MTKRRMTEGREAKRRMTKHRMIEGKKWPNVEWLKVENDEDRKQLKVEITT